MATTSAGSELGAAEFITKPVEFDALKAQLRQLPNAAD
jgi:DNA-binding response OmpR family regulator